MADHTRQQRARTHVGAAQSDAREQERDLAPRRADPDIARERDRRAGAGADAVDGSDDGLRAVPHRLHEIAGHARERENVAGAPRLLHLNQRPNDLVDVAA